MGYSRWRPPNEHRFPHGGVDVGANPDVRLRRCLFHTKTRFKHRSNPAVISIHSPFNGRRGVSLPFTDFCPILADDLVLRDRLFKTAVEYGKHRRWRYLELRSGKPPTTEATPSIWYLEHLVELADDDTVSRRLGAKRELRFARLRHRRCVWLWSTISRR